MSGARTTVKAATWAVALLAWLPTAPARAMNFTTAPIDAGTLVIGTGQILLGDRAKLVALLDVLPFTAPAKALVVDSPGGNILEAERLAGTIRSSRLMVGVTQGSVCASACFLMFAAGSQKFAQVGARIGVHSASVDASETMGTMAATTAMARDASAYGVPPGIVGRMVTTGPGQMAWLSAEELRSMGAALIPADTSSPSGSPVAPSPSPFGAGQTTASLASPGSVPPSMAFQQGLGDRRAWEAWFASLSPVAHAGALYWSAQRSLKQPGPCTAFPPDVAPVDHFEWGAGCVDAKKRLTPSDVRRKTEPDYRAGWNSL